ncbi:hydantoinase/oxoprolinase family protein [Actinoplanes bogorensis]|uniref:Hydantoinase/oxoprolinase family protein n=1 Tax=Paractinoplanes bogorensis TaxID=1610840 RepID=A0ABS5YVQ2_9ACTN|nr:hydantoinase/oxoprolinase family protein [Actinoplanes bogorensis]MBU2666180.1 hydantoinase/oxoprolinase family protein [Actinoplanes bogorensis]
MSEQFRVAVDIGGTFTDVVVYEETSGQFRTGKSPTTPDDLVRGVVEAMNAVVDDPDAVRSFVHGTTVGLNALLQRRGERVALLATKGVGDSYFIARGHRLDIFNIHHVRPTPLVAKPDLIEIGGRLDWQGDEKTPLDPADLERAAAYIREQGIRSVAIAFLFSYLDGRHEQAAADYLSAALPGVTITMSHEAAREWREYERTSTAVLSAYSGPTVRDYLSRLEKGLAEKGISAPVRVMQSNGGIIGIAKARTQPLQTFFSGPVGGAAGGEVLSARTGRPNLICVDMGGTSFDMSLIVGGKPEILPHADMESFPALMSVVDIKTIGAGGGSVAYVEAGGLRVGPESAGAVPGPACYGRGGTQPTVTDANLLLGRIDPGAFLGGKMRLDVDAAKTSMDALAGELGLDPYALAEGIVDVINAKMAQAIRAITVERGIEPRDFSLVAFGGAGALHAAALAEALAIGEVVVPALPGAFSAWGMLQSPLRQDFTRSFFRKLDDLSPAALDEAFAPLEADAREALRTENVESAEVDFRRQLDTRYVGQEHTITMALTETLVDDFHEEYRRRYGHASPGAPLEVTTARLTLLADVDFPAVSALAEEAVPERDLPTQTVIFGRRSHDTARIDRDALKVGERLTGPLIIDEPTSVTIVPPGWVVSVDGFKSLILTKDAA